MTTLRISTFTLLCLGLCQASAVAQVGESTARVGIDAEASLRTTVTADQKPQSMFMIDSVQHLRVAGDWTIVSRPMAMRRTGAEWAIHLAQFALRRESTAGPIATRLEVGLLPSPVGLGALEARASANPTITSAASFGRGVTVETGAPPVQLYPLTYPVGAQALFSTRWWDARVGLMDTTPLRVRWPLEKNQPQPTPHVLLAGGVTPRAGLRVGGWFMRGDWVKASEFTGGKPADRRASSGGVEVEYSVAWTKVAAEWVGASVDTVTGTAAPSTWNVEGIQTLTPRWFAAARLRRAEAFSVPGRSYTGPVTAAGLRQVFECSREAVVGFRVTPEVTLRAGYLVNRAYGAPTWIHRGEASVVWAQRWR